MKTASEEYREAAGDLRWDDDTPDQTIPEWEAAIERAIARLDSILRPVAPEDYPRNTEGKRIPPPPGAEEVKRKGKKHVKRRRTSFVRRP